MTEDPVPTPEPIPAESPLPAEPVAPLLLEAGSSVPMAAIPVPPCYFAPHRGPLCLTMGIISAGMVFFCCIGSIPLGIVTWVLAAHDLRRMRDQEMDPSGRGQTLAGLICGVSSVALVLLVISAEVLFFLYAFHAIKMAVPPSTVAPMAPPPLP